MSVRDVRPIPIKDRVSFVFLEYGQVDVQDSAFVLVDERGVRVHVPIGGVAVVFLEPGTRVSHRAVELAADAGTLLCWVGEAGTRLYAVGQPGGARSDALMYQAALTLDADARLRVVRKMYEVRFGEPAPQRRSLDQLRGIEGARVRETYKRLAAQYGVPWAGRRYDPRNWRAADLPNRCLSAATSCLYGVTEAAILAAGYSPSMGFLHTGKPKSFVYDIADLVKFDTVVPVAFEVAAGDPRAPAREVRHRCRDAFREHRTLAGLIPLIQEVLDAGGLPRPAPPPYAIPPAFEEDTPLGDDGHRG